MDVKAVTTVEILLLGLYKSQEETNRLLRVLVDGKDASREDQTLTPGKILKVKERSR